MIALKYMVQNEEVVHFDNLYADPSNTILTLYENDSKSMGKRSIMIMHIVKMNHGYTSYHAHTVRIIAK